MKIQTVDRVKNQYTQHNKTINGRKNKQNQYQQNFKGAGVDVAFNLLDSGFKLLDKNAMIQVAFVDSVATDIPRTLVDLKTGLAAALETMRREFSGLIVNCLIPGVIVKGVAKALPKDEILKGTNVAGSWANGAVIDRLSEVYNNAQKTGAADKTRTFVEESIKSLSGLDGKNWISYADKATHPEFQDAVSKVTEAITKSPKERKVLLGQAQEKLAGLTKAESILRFNGKPQANLGETLRDIADMGAKFDSVKKKTVQSLGDNVDDALKSEKVAEAVNKYSSSLKGLVNKKSIIGMAAVIAMAVSVQKINRAITRKQFNAEGAPIYKDFGKKETKKKMTEEEKRTFNMKKAATAAGMVGMAAASMMKKPTLGMFQFSNIFPTLDQCRWIASSTFASRMLAAEDENELRESAVRDIASFAGLYFLGDYVKKGVASGFEALSKTKQGAKLVGENVVLLNRTKEVQKPVIEQGASFLKKATSQIGFRAKQFGNWIKNTELKGASEVANIKTRNLRNICRVADIAFSIVMLGILLPKYNRSVTEKKVAAAKLQEEQQKKAMLDFSKVQQQNTPEIFKNMI
ncbi:MAG: hypothetical protein IJY61_08755 [Candidatus Gastranaerophilales bacterium]|nr:hypothetical protein [Candidatus Gastranaerophilales bacterium]